MLQEKNGDQQHIKTFKLQKKNYTPFELFIVYFQNQEFLKPQIAGGLANAEIYCLALGNIYSDPNYHNLNHSAILQTLSRKGVFELSNGQLTETTLIQTHPLRIVSI